MSPEDNIYQVVFLVNIENLRNDRSFKRNAILSSLKILTFYSCKAKTESKKLQWGFTFYNESSYITKSLPICRFRDFNLKNIEEFESVLNKISDCSEAESSKNPNKCHGCNDRSCDCKRNTPAAILSRAFTEVLSSFPWDNPDISSPIKFIPTRRSKCHSENLSGHNRRSSRNLNTVERQPRSNILFLLSKCPISKNDLARYIPDCVITDSDYLLEELMPTGIRKDFHHAMKISLFWIDTHTQISSEDISGLCTLAQAIDQLGKLITLPALLGSRDLDFLSDATIDETHEKVATLSCGDILPGSTSLRHYLLQPSAQCRYDEPVNDNHVIIEDAAGSQLATCHVNLITSTYGGSPVRPRMLTLLGTLPASGVPLHHIEARPVYSLMETKDYGLWTQLLSSLAKKNMVLVVECLPCDGYLSTVCIIQALTEMSASLTILKAEGMLNIQKKVSFSTSPPCLSCTEIDTLTMGLKPELSQPDGECEEMRYRAPVERDTFDCSLLETWLLPSATPSSLSVLADIFSNGDIASEDVHLLEKLQRAYMEKKSKRFTNMSSSSTPCRTRTSPRKQLITTKKSNASPTRRSPRKKSEQQPCRRSPRKSKDPLSNQSLLDLDRRGRSNTAPTRVDIIMQKSKQTRYHSTDGALKKPGRKSTETVAENKRGEQEESVVFAAEDELFDYIKELYSGALSGQHTPVTTMIKITAIIISFVSKNQQCSSEDLLRKSVMLTTIEVSKKHSQNTQQEKIKEFECQLLLWMEAIHRGVWTDSKDQLEEATEQVVGMLRRLSFLQEPVIWTAQLSDIMARYGESDPAVLHEVYAELGQPIPTQLQDLFSPDGLDSTIDSQPPTSAHSYVDSIQTHQPGILSNKQRTRRVVRHTSFHVAPQRQIKVTVGNKTKNGQKSKRRSARIASTSKVKPTSKDVAAEETKRIRRNLFSGGEGGVKLERRQSVAVMEANEKSTKSRVKQLIRGGHHRSSSLVSETPTHKQIPNQLWQRQERQRQRSRTVTTDVTVIQESPDKRLILDEKADSAPKGISNFVRRTSFYSVAPDKVSRAVKKCMDSRMTKRLLSPRHDPSAPKNLHLPSPHRRVQMTTLFSKLLDPSPHKPIRADLTSPTVTTCSRHERAVSMQHLGGFSSPSKNTRSKMRLFQSPSPHKVAPVHSEQLVINARFCDGTPKKGHFDYPVGVPSVMTQFESPSRNTRLNSKHMSPHSRQLTSSGSIQRLFQSPPPGSALSTNGTPTRTRKLFQSPPPGSATPGKGTTHVFQSPAHATPTKARSLFQSSEELCTPTKGASVPHSARTPIMMRTSLTDFSSPSKNTRSYSKIFQPPYEDHMAVRMPRSDGPVRRLHTTLLAGSMLADSEQATNMITLPGSETTTSFMELQSPVKNVLTLPNVSTPSKNTRSHTTHSSHYKSSPVISVQSSEFQCSDDNFQSVSQSPHSSRTLASPVGQKHSLNHWQRKKKINVSPEVVSPLIRKVKASRMSSWTSQESVSSVTIDNIKTPSTPRGKRKLNLMSSPEQRADTPTKRCKSSKSPSVRVSHSSIDYFDNEEVFIEHSDSSKQLDSAGVALCVRNKLFCSSNLAELQLLRNPSVEYLKSQSGSSSIPSPVFPGMERLLLEDVPSSPGSPIFHTTPSRQNKENTQDNVSPKSALSHFSPRLSRKSLSHLVTSPLLDIVEQKSRRASSIMTSPDKYTDLCSPKKDDSFLHYPSDGRTEGSNGQTPRGTRKTFCRMPTKLSL